MNGETNPLPAAGAWKFLKPNCQVFQYISTKSGSSS